MCSDSRQSAITGDWFLYLVTGALVHQLHPGDFIVEARNIVLTGGPGTGKNFWRPPSA